MLKKEIVSLYCGIGAIEKGFANQDIPMEVVAFCDINDHAAKCYSVLHDEPMSKYVHDVTTIKDGDIKKGVDLLSHGSPCQDVSINGKEEGADKDSNTRSSLLWYSVDIIKDVMPKVVIWENVKNILSEKHIHNVKDYMAALDEVGYKSVYKVINSNDYNIPQGRERIFVVSQLNGEEFIFPDKTERTTKLVDLCRFREKDDITDNFYKYYNTHVYEDGFTKCQKNNNTPFELFLRDIKPGRTNVKNMGMYKYDQLNRITVVDDSLKVKSPTLSCRGAQNYTIKYEYNERIYKPSPLMCCLLMGFDESDFDKIKNIGTESELIDRFGNSIVVNVWEALLNQLYK